MEFHCLSIRIVRYWVALLQDPVLGYRLGAHDAARVYNAAPSPKNKVLLQGPLWKVYSISKVYDFTLILSKSNPGKMWIKFG